MNVAIHRARPETGTKELHSRVRFFFIRRRVTLEDNVLREQLETLAVLQDIDLEVKNHRTARTERVEEIERAEAEITRLTAEVNSLREAWQERERFDAARNRRCTTPAGRPPKSACA